MERKNVIVYFDMHFEEDRALFEKLRPYIVRRRGNEFIKAAIREKFERLAGGQPKTAAFESSSLPNGGLELPKESRVPPVHLVHEPVQESTTILGDRPPSETVRAAEVIKPMGAAYAHEAFQLEGKVSVQKVIPSEPSTKPRPKLGRLM